MPSVLRSAFEIALEYGIPAALAGLAAWAGVKRKAIRDRLRKSRHRRDALDAFIECQMPTLTEFVNGMKAREDAAAAREVRITTEFAALGDHLKRQDAKLESILARVWGAMKLDPQARFHCDENGRNLEVNSAYAKMLRTGEASLLGFGYKNFIDPAGRDGYIRAEMQAFKEHRRFEGNVVMIRGDNSRFLAHVRLEPYPEDPEDGPALNWFGSVTVIEEIDG